MGYTNYTPNHRLPQFVDTDKPTWLGDVNLGFSKIDAAFTTNEGQLNTQGAQIVALQNQVATLNSQILILKASIIANGGVVSGI